MKGKEEWPGRHRKLLLTLPIRLEFLWANTLAETFSSKRSKQDAPRTLVRAFLSPVLFLLLSSVLSLLQQAGLRTWRRVQRGRWRGQRRKRRKRRALLLSSPFS